MFAIFFVVVNCFLWQTTTGQELEFLRGGKPGTCHILHGFDFGICPFYCKKDSECPLSLKCCPTKCGGLICSVPVNTTTVVAVQAVEAEVEVTTVSSVSDNLSLCPGPLFEPGQCGPLKFATCTKDSHCVANMRCCFNGCVNTCRAPQHARSGYCPRINLRCRRKICSADSDCAQGLKCCSGGCLCTMPRGLGVGGTLFGG